MAKGAVADDAQASGAAPMLQADAAAMAGTWKCKGRKVNGVRLDAAGLSVGGRADLRLKRDEIIGAQVEGPVLRLVGYRTRRVGVMRSSRLERREVLLESVGEKSVEANCAIAKRYYDVAMDLLGRSDPAQESKPLLVFVNPASGIGISTRLWDAIARKVLCEDANHVVELVRTTRQDHALDLIKGHADLVAAYKGIVIVSGDGLVYEVVQGLMGRRDWPRCARHLPLGVIPGGSGNGMAKSLTFASGLPHSVCAAAVVVAKMKTVPLDVSVVDLFKSKDAPPERVYSVLSLEWGMIADVDIGSEAMRWAGSARFMVQFLKNLANPRKYGARLSFLPAGGAPADKLPTSSSSPGLQAPRNYWDLHPELVDSADADPPACHLVPPDASTEPGKEWVTIEDRFTNMWNCNVAWMAEDAHVAPHSQPGDGWLQLQYIRDNGPQRINRRGMVSYVLGVEKGAHIKLKCVETTPTLAYRLELKQLDEGGKPGIVAIDGELVECSMLQMEHMRGLLRAFCVSPAAAGKKTKKKK